MGSFSYLHWMILIVLVVLLFGGRGKISGIMGDVAHGIRNFRDGLKDPKDSQDSQERPAIRESERNSAEIKRKEEVRS